MSVQMCEGIWRTRCGQRVVVTRCESDDGRQWTDGVDYYSYDGSIWGDEQARSRHDLVAFVGLLPDKSQVDQAAEIARLQAELQQTQAWRSAATDAHSQSETLRIEQATEIERLKAEWRSEFTAAQQLRSEVQQLEGLNYKLSEALRDLQEDHTAMDHRAEGARLAFLDVIKTLLEMRR